MKRLISLSGLGLVKGGAVSGAENPWIGDKLITPRLTIIMFYVT